MLFVLIKFFTSQWINSEHYDVILPCHYVPCISQRSALRTHRSGPGECRPSVCPGWGRCSVDGCKHTHHSCHLYTLLNLNHLAHYKTLCCLILFWKRVFIYDNLGCAQVWVITLDFVIFFSHFLALVCSNVICVEHYLSQNARYTLDNDGVVSWHINSYYVEGIMCLVTVLFHMHYTTEVTLWQEINNHVHTQPAS